MVALTASSEPSSEEYLSYTVAALPAFSRLFSR